MCNLRYRTVKQGRIGFIILLDRGGGGGEDMICP